jgi:hypothetical protein
MLRELAVKDTLDALIPPHERHAVTVGECVEALVLTMLTGEHALSRVADTLASYDLAVIFQRSLEAAHFHDNRLGRALDALWTMGLDRIYGAVISQAIQQYALDMARLHTDTTSLKVYGAYEREEDEEGPLVTFGYSRDHRPDLRQLLFGLTVTADGVPVWGPVADGNRSDRTEHRFHIHCLADHVYLPTIVSGRLIWHLGYTEDKSASAFTESYREFQRAAYRQEPCYRVQGVLTDGFDSTITSVRTLFPGVRIDNCLLHAVNKLPGKLTALTSSVRKACRARFYTLFHRGQQRKSLRVFALGQQLRRFMDHVSKTAGAANGEDVRQWIQGKKAGWYAVLEDPRMPVTSTLLDQAHNAIDRKLFMMKGFHHPLGSQQAFLHGLALLYNVVPYQHRAKHAGQCGVEVEGGRLPTQDWLLNLQILTSGGFAVSCRNALPLNAME